jgi:hypothetical protein
MPSKKSPMRMFAAACIVVVGVVAVVGILIYGAGNENATGRDFIQYWSIEQQLVHGGNPYDEAAILPLQKAVGLAGDQPIFNFGPPVAWFFALPLGWVSAKTGLALWLSALLGCLALSVWLLWLLHGKPDSRYHVIAFAFPPALWCLVAGQLGIFFLVETILFTYFIEKRPIAAGVSLVFFAMKPQLFLPFFLVLLLWSISRKKARVVGGFFVAVGISCALTYGIDRQIWQQYHEMLRTHDIVDMFVPTAGMALRFAVNPHLVWPQFIFEAIACLWAGWYFVQRRKQWDWTTDGSLVLLVAMAATPYEWFTDQALLFPALLIGLYRVQHSVRALVFFGIVALAGLVGFVVQIPLTSAYYVWTAPAWLLWYLYADRVSRASEVTQPEMLETVHS